jgi:hypothetical protein
MPVMHLGSDHGRRRRAGSGGVQNLGEMVDAEPLAGDRHGDAALFRCSATSTSIGRWRSSPPKSPTAIRAAVATQTGGVGSEPAHQPVAMRVDRGGLTTVPE